MEESNQKGWLKLYRKMLDWGWYDDTTVKSAFIHCLLKANIEDTEWHGEYLPAGSFITSIANFSSESGLSKNQTRRAWKCLEKSGEITRKAHNRYTQIIVNNWAKFQSYERTGTNKPQTDHKQSTNKPQTDHKQSTTDKEYKNIRNKEYKNIGAGTPSPGDILPPSPSPFLEDREIYIEKQEAQEMEKKAQPKLPEGTTEEQAVSFYGLLDAIMAGDYKEPEKEDTEQEATTDDNQQDQ